LLSSVVARLPGSADAKQKLNEMEPHLRLRTELMEAVRKVIRRDGLRQSDAAALFGVAQPRVSDLVRGKVELFSIDTLVGMLAAAGVHVNLEMREARRPRRRSHS
jgi:predicted XRE-type DNA-binding protein